MHKGPLVRIGPDWVVTSDPAEIRRIWSLHSGYSRSPWYRGLRFDPGKDTIITATDNKEHGRVRAHLLPGYQGRGLEDPEPVVDAQLAKFISLIEQKYTSSPTAFRPLDMSNAMQFLTQDIISAIEFGAPFGYLDADADMYGIIAIFEALLGSVMVMALFPWLVKLLALPIVRPLLPKSTDPRGPGRLLGLVKDHVDARYDGGASGQGKVRRKDVLQSFVESGLSRDEVESEALIHMVGGTDTTALALRNAVFFVASNAVAYRKLQSEIDVVVEESSLSPSDIVPCARARVKPYLQAVIKEALRMWPPVMGLMARSSERDDTICGLQVPARTHVAWSALAVMKDRAIFGADADVFAPERWLTAEPEQLKAMEGVQGLVFAGGTRWECLGKRLAQIELEKTLFEVSTSVQAYYAFSFCQLCSLNRLANCG
jgi:cytochrome P450